MYHQLQLILDKMSRHDAAFFRSIRLRMRLTQQELAGLLQVDRKTISRAEHLDSDIDARLIYSVMFLHGVHSELVSQQAAAEFDEREREKQRVMREREAIESMVRASEKQHVNPESSRATHPPSGKGRRAKKKRKHR